jgi:hypothetical protein
MKVSGQLQVTANLPPGERNRGTYLIGCRVGPRASQDVVAKKKSPCPCRELNPVFQPVGQPLYSLNLENHNSNLTNADGKYGETEAVDDWASF